MRKLTVGLLVAGGLLASVLEASAQMAQVERGRAIAEAKCALCHAVGKTGASPHKIVIPFRELSTRFPVDMLLETLKTGVISGHDEMPMFDLGPDDARALIAYIDSLSTSGARYLPDLPRP